MRVGSYSQRHSTTTVYTRFTASIYAAGISHALEPWLLSYNNCRETVEPGGYNNSVGDLPVTSTMREWLAHTSDDVMVTSMSPVRVVMLLRAGCVSVVFGPSAAPPSQI